MKGGERERFNPLSGAKYDRLESHDANELEDVQASSSSKKTGRDAYQAKRGRPKYFKREERAKWKGKGRDNSPYQKHVTESSTKTVEVNAKSKDKP